MDGRLFLYGPPGSGKSTLGRRLAVRLARTFVDLDAKIESDAGRSIPEIFAEEGEAGFRARELAALKEVAADAPDCVVSLGGGALLAPAAREVAESAGRVVCLECPLDELAARVARSADVRPLVAAEGAEAARARLEALLEKRAEHYASFKIRLDSGAEHADALAGRLETLLGAYRILSGDVPSDVRVGEGLLDTVGEMAALRSKARRAVVVCDSHVAPLYSARAVASLEAAGMRAQTCVIQPGEENKTISAVMQIWEAFRAAGLSRSDIAVAVGGGVAGDLTGFAAATWMRGIGWVNVPTTLLSMVDASTGGKTGFDLPGAKNMAGAFHSPFLVLADVSTLATLPAREIRCGLAEAIKHGFIADPTLTTGFGALAGLAKGGANGKPVCMDLKAVAAFVSKALSVKVDFVRKDPFEKGDRAKLNLGHTVGHAIEVKSNFAVKHGEAVAIGTVEEARLAVRLGLAPAGWPDEVARAFAEAGLPVEMPEGMTFATLGRTMKLDKKKSAGGKIRFALPCGPADVRLVPVEV